MFHQPEQFIAGQRAGINALLGIANAAFTGAGRMAELQLGASRALFEAGATQARRLLDARDPQEFAALQQKAAQPDFDALLGFGRDVALLASQSQKEIAAIVDAQHAEFNRALAASVDQFAQNAPAGSEFAVGAMKSALGSANAAYDNLVRVSRQMSEMVEANLQAAAPAKPEGKARRAA